MITPAMFITTIVCLALAAVAVFVLIGSMALVDFAKFNRRKVDDQPPASWIAKQEGRG